MNVPVPNTPTHEISPQQSAVLRSLRESQRLGDAAAVATWLAIAAELNLPASVVGVDPN
jgi:hypothetical protein